MPISVAGDICFNDVDDSFSKICFSFLDDKMVSKLFSHKQLIFHLKTNLSCVLCLYFLVKASREIP